MEHLNTEQLARLVDERPTEEEQRHLADCPACADELAAYRSQTAALGALPEIMPPKGDWQVLEAQLRSEGLVRDPGLFQRLGLARTPDWMKAAAAVMLFLAGTGTGATLTSATADAGPVDETSVSTIEEAASAVRAAEENYVNAVSRYQSMRSLDGDYTRAGDPHARLAALEKLVEASQAAVWWNPEDPFLNGFLTTATAERNAAAQVVMASDNWF